MHPSLKCSLLTWSQSKDATSAIAEVECYAVIFPLAQTTVTREMSIWLSKHTAKVSLVCNSKPSLTATENYFHTWMTDFHLQLQQILLYQ